MVLQRFPTPSAPAPSPKPADFGEGYRPPAHKTYPLARYNYHPADDKIVFFEEPHVYLVDGRPAMCSMTQLAHSRQEHFDAVRVIRGMKEGRSSLWPRRKYVVGARRVARHGDEGGEGDLPWDACTMDHDYLCAQGDKTVAVFPKRCFGDELAGRDLVGAIFASMGADASQGGVASSEEGATARKRRQEDEDGGSSHCATPAPVDFDSVWCYERSMTDEEIVASWKANGTEASNRGTEAHYQMQLAVEAQPFRESDEEVRIGLAFFARVRSEWRAFRTEWEVWYQPAGLAGSIDLVIARGGGEEDDDGAAPLELAIVDYKRSNKLEKGLTGYKKMAPPFSHLDDCDGAAYALQLSGYQRMLEEMGFVVVDRVLVSIHPEAPCTVSVPYLEAEVEYLFACERAAMASEETLPASCKCAETGVGLTDAVLVSGAEDKGLVHRKIAQAKEWNVIDSDALVSARVVEVRDRARESVATPAFASNWKRKLKEHRATPSVVATEWA